MYGALFEELNRPLHAVTGAEQYETGTSTDFTTVYAHRFVVGDDCMRIFDPTNIKGFLQSTDTCREYILEVTGTGFFNLHHRTVIGIGQFVESDDPDRLYMLSNGWRLADALLPSGSAPYTWPVNYSICLLGEEGYWSENVICQFNDLYDYDMVTYSGMVGNGVLVNEYSLNYFISQIFPLLENPLNAQYGSAEIVSKMTTDAYIHKFYGLATSIAISKCEDENVIVTIRLLRRQLADSVVEPMYMEEQPL